MTIEETIHQLIMDLGPARAWSLIQGKTEGLEEKEKKALEKIRAYRQEELERAYRTNTQERVYLRQDILPGK